MARILSQYSQPHISVYSYLYCTKAHPLTGSKSRHNDPHSIMAVPRPQFYTPFLPPGNLNSPPGPSQGLQLQQPEP